MAEAAKRLIRRAARVLFEGKRSMERKDMIFPPSGSESAAGDAIGGGTGGGGAASKNSFEKLEEKGLVVLVIDALTRRGWVKEEELASDLNLPSRLLRQVLSGLEREQFVVRVDRKEKKKVAATAKEAKATGKELNSENGKSGKSEGKNPERKKKSETRLVTWCCLDFGHAVDVIRYRLFIVKKRIRDELDTKKDNIEYLCPRLDCGLRFTALDANRLLNPKTLSFHCENCGSELVPEGLVEAIRKQEEEEEGGQASAGELLRKRRETLRDVLSRIDKDLEPLAKDLGRVANGGPAAIPLFVPLNQYLAIKEKGNNELRAASSSAVLGQSKGSPTSRGMPPDAGTLRFEVSLDEQKRSDLADDKKINGAGDGKIGGSLANNDNPKASGSEISQKKALPPWLTATPIKPLEMKQNDPAPEQTTPTVKLEANDNDANEYLRKYQETMINRKREMEGSSAASADGQPLKKVKLEENAEVEVKVEEHDDNNDFEWEDAENENDAQKTETVKEEDGFEWEDA